MGKNVDVYVVDAGSVSKGNFHWVSSKAPHSESSDIEAMAKCVCDDLRLEKKVAIGFECPLFVPCPENQAELGLARIGEIDVAFGSRPFNAGAGASVTLAGFQALGWILREVHERFPGVRASTRWDELEDGTCELFIWEAFVSGSEKGLNHHEDAQLALEAFEKNQDRMSKASRIKAESPISLAGALILWSGMSHDLTLLHAPCVVLRPIFDNDAAAIRLQNWKAKAEEKRRAKKSASVEGRQAARAAVDLNE